MKNNSNNNMATMVEIPATTLNALKGLLFNSENGVDLSGIINDLGGDDLTAINVALAFKKLVPEIDRKLRYSLSYIKDSYTVYEYQNFSLIRGTVDVIKQTIYFDNRREPYSVQETLPIAKWYEFSTEKPEQPVDENK